MAVLAIFPFFITGAALFCLVGEESERAAAINAILFALPPVVGGVIGPVARERDRAAQRLAAVDRRPRRAVDRRQPGRDDPRHPAPRLRHARDPGVLEVPAAFDRDHPRRGGAADAEPDRAVPDRRRAASDRGLGAAALRRDRRAVAVAVRARRWALRLALPAVLHADPGRLPQAALSQVARRAAGDRVVGRRPPPRCRRCCAACSATTPPTARSPGS